MKFFTKFFNSIKNKSSVNFLLNLFFLKQMLSVNINHTLTPHIFLPFKNLKIKFFKTELANYWIYLSLLSICGFFIIGLILFI